MIPVALISMRCELSEGSAEFVVFDVVFECSPTSPFRFSVSFDLVLGSSITSFCKLCEALDFFDDSEGVDFFILLQSANNFTNLLWTGVSFLANLSGDVFFHS